MDGTFIGTREWCAECKTFRTVEDDHEEAYLTGSAYGRSTTENTVQVLDLSCGHSKEFAKGSTTYRDPGA